MPTLPPYKETSDPSKPGNPQDDFNTNYVNESHIEAFAHALNADYFIDNDYLDSPRHSPSLRSLNLSPVLQSKSMSTTILNGLKSPRIRKVSALSDFAPVNLRVRRRKRGYKHEKRQDWLFTLVRWPLLMFIFLFIFFEFGMYVFVRQCVNAKEWFTAWTGRKGQLRKKMRASKTYEEWKEAALELDKYLGFDEWKRVDEDPYYDWKLVRKVLKSLRSLRRSDDARGVLGVLETCIRTNFAGVESQRLYSETFYGTKDLIESYITEVERSLVYIRETPILSNEEKRRFFKSANMNLGISALCLSGGATFGYYHFGVIKALVQNDLLPRVITGTSAGGLVAALAATRTDAELKAMLVPELADKITACEEPFRKWFKRFRETGARFDSVDWARKACFFTRGSLTFREAYQKTGRILNISVIPADRHSPTKLLNYLTAPDTVIWSALIASAAVPGILNPVVLMQKTRDGNLIPWNWGSKFKDGSLRSDIPLQSLNHYFNVTHPVVSQVNPHVHLFFFAPRGSAGKPVAHRKGKGWRGNFLLSAAEQWLKLELTKNFKVIRDLDLLPQLLGQDWSSVFLQRFDGTVTIWPRTRLMDWINILSDPDRQELERMMKVGEFVTWPKLHIIENRLRLEREILQGRRAVRRAMSSREPIPPLDMDAGHIPDISMGTALSPDAEVGRGSGSLATDNEGPRLANDSLHRAWPPTHLDHVSGSSTPFGMKGSQDPLRSMSRRRRWASHLLDEADMSPTPPHEAARENAHKLHPPDASTMASSSTPELHSLMRFTHLPSNGFFRSLRNHSFGRFTAPFHTFQKEEKETEEAHHESTWSSDSSELEDEFNFTGADYEDQYNFRGPVLSSSRELSPEVVQDEET